MDFFKRPVFLGIFLVALVISITWSYLDKRRQEKAGEARQKSAQSVGQPEITTLANVDPTDFDAAIKEEYALANTKALQANSTNKLAALDIKISADLKPGNSTTSYIYASNDDKNNWAITFSQSSGNYLRALIPKEDYLGMLQVLNTGLWKFNYVTAFQIAEKTGGADWRAGNNLTGLTLTLSHLPPKNWLMWTVQYQSKDQTLVKNIDANSGRVIEDYASSTAGNQE